MTKFSPVFSILLAFMANGCISVDYMGKSFPKTNKVAVYTKKSELPPDYSVIGRAVVTAPYKFSREEMQARMIEKAKDEGADGVHITSYMILPGGSARLDQASESSHSTTDHMETNTQASIANTEQNFNYGYGQMFQSPSKDTSTYKRVLKAQFIKIGQAAPAPAKKEENKTGQAASAPAPKKENKK